MISFSTYHFSSCNYLFKNHLDVEVPDDLCDINSVVCVLERIAYSDCCWHTSYSGFSVVVDAYATLYKVTIYF